jgi:hypothetical protein
MAPMMLLQTVSGRATVTAAGPFELVVERNAPSLVEADGETGQRRTDRERGMPDTHARADTTPVGGLGVHGRNRAA